MRKQHVGGCHGKGVAAVVSCASRGCHVEQRQRRIKATSQDKTLARRWNLQ